MRWQDIQHVQKDFYANQSTAGLMCQACVLYVVSEWNLTQKESLLGVMKYQKYLLQRSELYNKENTTMIK